MKPESVPLGRFPSEAAVALRARELLDEGSPLLVNEAGQVSGPELTRWYVKTYLKHTPFVKDQE